jgi:vacuolar-type H+-ATPase subunit C/Vma6
LLDPRYAYVSAYLKAGETNVFASEHLSRMLGISNIHDIQSIIRETEIGNYLEGVSLNNFDDLDQSLWRYFAHCVKEIESFHFLPGDIKILSTIYVEKYDVANIKAALQTIGSTNNRNQIIPVGIIHDNELLDELSCAENVADISELLSRSQLAHYIPIIEDFEPDGSAKSRLLLGARLDGEYFRVMLDMASKIREGETLAQSIGIIIDLTNLQIVARAIIEGIGTEVADYAIPGGYIITDKTIRDLLAVKIADMPSRLGDGKYYDIAKELSNSFEKTKRVTIIDDILDTYKFKLLRESLSPTILSPLVMAWYLILKETEIRNLRIIFRAIYDNVSIEEIKGYLVF